MFPEKGPFQKENEIVFQPIHFQGDLRSLFGDFQGSLFFYGKKKWGNFPPQEVGQRMDLVMIFRPRGFTLYLQDCEIPSSRQVFSG